MNDLIKKIIDKAKSGSTLTKVLLIIALAAAVAFLVSGCSTNRTFSVSVDKADSVKVNYADSTTANYPMLY